MKSCYLLNRPQERLDAFGTEAAAQDRYDSHKLGGLFGVGENECAAICFGPDLGGKVRLALPAQAEGIGELGERIDFGRSKRLVYFIVDSRIMNNQNRFHINP